MTGPLLADSPLPDPPQNIHDWPGVAAIGLWVIAILGGAVIMVWHRNNYNEARDERELAQADRITLKQDTAAIKGQVVNGHTEGMRDELDRSFGLLMDKLDRVEKKVDRHGVRLDRIEEQGSRLEMKIDNVDGRVTAEKDHRHQLGRQLTERIEGMCHRHEEAG